MEDFKVRLQEEEFELENRKHKLFEFAKSEKFEELSEDIQTHLVLQLNAMELYSHHLRKRMELLDVPLK